MAKIKQTVKDTPLFMLGDLLPKAGAFLLLPFLTVYLSPEELGISLFCVVLSSLLATLCSLNIQSVVIRFGTDFIKNFSYLNKLFSTITIFLIFSTVITNLIFFVLGIILLKQTSIDIDFKLYIYTIFLASVTAPYEIYQRILIVTKRTKMYLFNQIFNFLIYSGVLFSLIFLNFSYYSIILASIASYCFFYLLLIRHKNITLFTGFDKNIYKDIFHYSIKLVPNRLVALLPNFFDRAILSSISFANTALYSIGYRLGESSSYLASGFFKTYPRWLFLSLKKYDQNFEKIKKVFSYIFIISLCTASAFTIIAEDFVKFYLDERYHEAWVVIPIIAFTVFFNNIRVFWLNFILFDKKKVYLVIFSTMTFSFLSITIMLLTYKSYGIVGIASSILFARFSSLIVILVLVKQLKYKIFGLSQIILSLLFIVLLFSVYSIKLNVLIKFMLILICGICILYYVKKLYYLDDREK